MVTKAIIIQRIVNSNNYLVRVPFLDTAGIGSGKRVATLCTNPSIMEEYKPDDVVYVSFEDHKANKVVILGSLYIDNKGPRGSANFESLMVSNEVKLPANTTIDGRELSSILTKIDNFEGSGSGNANVNTIPVVSFVNSLLTNIDGQVLSDYKIAPFVSSNDSGYIILTSNNQNLDLNQSKQFMKLLTGSNYVSTGDTPLSTYVIYANDYTTYRFKYDENSYGLKAHLVSGMAQVVRNNQMTLGIIRDTLHNLNNDNLALHGFGSTELIIDTYEVYKITKSGNNLTKEEAGDYMAYMCGSRYVPEYNYEHPQNTYLFTTDGLILKPQFGSTNGLLLYKMKSLQEKLVSSINIKTINGQSLLGSGNITVSGGGTIVGDYLPLAGGTITGDTGVYFKETEGSSESGRILYENHTSSEDSKMSITNPSGKVVINSKEEGNTVIDGVPINVLSQEEIEEILSDS